MDITTNGSGKFILSAAYSELNQSYITFEYTKKLVSHVFNLYPLPANIAIDLYEGHDSVLIFVHMPRIFYRFDNFEDVISACKSCRADDSALYYYDEEYILSVAFPHTSFSEFSTPEPRGEHYELFLTEHGKTIIGSNAVNFVKNTF